MTPKFSCCVIAKNESKTLSRLMASLKPFMDAGGDVNLLDTGSDDGTPELARSFGWNVKEVGDKFLIPITNYMAINQRFVVDGEKQVVKAGDKYFDFSAARNCGAEMARENVVFWYDADEVSVAMDIESINKTIEDGFTQWEYFFTFAFDQFGGEAVKFVQCKAYDRRVMKWEGRVHELIVNISNEVSGKRIFLDEQKYKLAHYQNHESGRHSYLVGLAVDCFEFPKNDRHSHYLARELYWNQRPKSALKEFKRHTLFNGWAAERAESLLFIGDIYGQQGEPMRQAGAYAEAFYTDSSRNSALIKLAFFFSHNNNHQAAICYAKAALEISYTGLFYADNLANYRELPQQILYTSYGWLGKIEEAQKHLLKALEYQPYNQQFLRDSSFYFEYGDNGIVGWMRLPELHFLYDLGKKYKKIVEIGSFKGKSTHALCSGNKQGTVWAVDTWEGSKDERDDTHWIAQREDVYSMFIENTKQFKNLIPIRKSSVDAAKDFEDKSLDAVFIDAGHLAAEVREDILAWLPKLKDDGMICGHDFQKDVWMTVVEGVESVFGKVDGTCDSIWFVDLSKRGKIELPAPAQIPKKVFTVWLGENMPELVKKCIESQKRMCDSFGYEHELITLDNVLASTLYFKQCINSTHPDGVKYCKATDYLRMRYLLKYGGVFLDADCEIVDGKSFDEMLNDEMFVGLEVADWQNGKVVLGTSTIGAIPNHPLIKEWLETVVTNFRGDTDDNYASSMEQLNLIGVKYQDRMKLYDPEYFYPKNSYTGELNVTDKTISIHHFTKLWTPETNKKSTLQQFKYNIENNINFTFVKRGDGELACMNGESGGNCDGHPYSEELGDKLREAYEYLKDKATIVEFDDQENYNVLLHRTDSNLKEVSDFYKAIGRSTRRKIFIAPSRLSGMDKVLGFSPMTGHINIPELNSFEIYGDILGAIPIVENGIYLFCAGMPAKSMIAWLMKENPNATYLDCGSAFDPSVGITRTFQISPEEFNRLYSYSGLDESDIVGVKDEPVNNFLLPQETHPERLWVAKELGCEVKTIYDLGAGTFKVTPHCIGVDVRPFTDVQASIDELPFDDISGDIIISKHSLEHVLDPVKAIKEWLRVLKPGGKMIIVLPDHEFINTIDPYYSAGEHLHAYTRESFKNLISLFPELHISKQETVLKDWSFGTVIYKLPKISFILPQLGREEGLKKCLQSIEDLDYPTHLKEITVIEGEETVPEKVAEGLKQSTGEFICYCANDMYFFPDTIRTAVIESLELNKGLVAFNTGPAHEGNMCEHFIIKRSIIDKIGGHIFDTRYTHLGVDQLLWQKCLRINEAFRSKRAVVEHKHFSTGKSDFDEVYAKVWNDDVMGKDRTLLSKDLISLNGH